MELSRDDSLLSSSLSDPVHIDLWSFGGVPNNTKVYAVAHGSSGVDRVGVQERRHRGIPS
jgi:hypothetical protein